MKIEPIVLEGDLVRLEPMRFDHIPALCKAGLGGPIWEWTTNVVKDESDIERYVRAALADHALGTSLPFVTVERGSSTVIGSTRLGNIDRFNRKAEIGWTWLNPGWQRTGMNTEAKLLMLTHAFDNWKCIRVELKTDLNNKQSQKAIKGIGAKKEGVLRNHMITESGRYRDSVFFSIIESEWDGVKAALTAKLRRRRPGGAQRGVI